MKMACRVMTMGYVVPPTCNGGRGWIAQLVEQRTENPCVAGSNPALATILFPQWFPRILNIYLNLYPYSFYVMCLIETERHSQPILVQSRLWVERDILECLD